MSHVVKIISLFGLSVLIQQQASAENILYLESMDMNMEIPDECVLKTESKFMHKLDCSSPSMSMILFQGDYETLKGKYMTQKTNCAKEGYFKNLTLKGMEELPMESFMNVGESYFFVAVYASDNGLLLSHNNHLLTLDKKNAFMSIYTYPGAEGKQAVELVKKIFSFKPIHKKATFEYTGNPSKDAIAGCECWEKAIEIKTHHYLSEVESCQAQIEHIQSKYDRNEAAAKVFNEIGVKCAIERELVQKTWKRQGRMK